MPELPFHPALELMGATAQALFTLSYFIFVFHIYRHKSAKGVSAFAVSQWLVAFSLLAFYFYVKQNWVFVTYYVVGACLSVIALEGLRRYK